MPLTVAIVGLGQMGRSHALAFHAIRDFRIISLVNRSKAINLPDELQDYPILQSFEEALSLKPDIVAICTHTDSHAPYAMQALQAGSHVFVEKPLATSVADARQVVDTARRTDRKLVVGYILQHHPSWQQFVHRARKVGPPYVFRMNLNQQSRGPTWQIHRKILENTSPMIDCGVHYIDLMLQISGARPTQVRGMGARLSNEIPDVAVNYSHLQLTFDDGSVGWYEAGWGPMISETAYSVKDVVGPRGSVSVVPREAVSSADVDRHTNVGKIRVHDAVTGKDEIVQIEDEPDHMGLCELEQRFLLDAVGVNLDLSKHCEAAVQSLQIVLAADESMRTGRAVDLED